ncbi:MULTISPECIES: hypothetical protein [Streptomyces]|uniref:hypothetical protein n=1 Tax=Streptomyces TaxID=1883 RepID=UPI00345C14E6
MVLMVCGSRDETKARDRCVLSLKPGAHLPGLRTGQGDQSTARARVPLAVEGPACVALGHLIARLSAGPAERDPA